MKKHGEDILFCALVALGSFFLPLLISFIFMAITDDEGVGSLIFAVLLFVCGIIAPVFCVFLKKHYLIYPAVNAVGFTIVSITTAIVIVSQFWENAIWKDGNEFEILTSIFMVPLTIILIVFIIGTAVVISVIASSGTLLVSYISKLIYDKKQKNTEIIENEGA